MQIPEEIKPAKTRSKKVAKGPPGRPVGSRTKPNYKTDIKNFESLCWKWQGFSLEDFRTQITGPLVGLALKALDSKQVSDLQKATLALRLIEILNRPGLKKEASGKPIDYLNLINNADKTDDTDGSKPKVE